MPCYCEQCTPEPRYTYSIEFMRLCEARYVARLAADARIGYINAVRDKRGIASANELRALVDAIAEARAVIAMPSLSQRRAYIEGVRLKRGEQSAEDLKELIKREWGNR